METYLGMSIKFVTFVFLNSMNSCSVLHIKTVIEKKKYVNNFRLLFNHP